MHKLFQLNIMNITRFIFLKVTATVASVSHSPQLKQVCQPNVTRKQQLINTQLTLWSISCVSSLILRLVICTSNYLYNHYLIFAIYVLVAAGIKRLLMHFSPRKKPITGLILIYLTVYFIFAFIFCAIC